MNARRFITRNFPAPACSKTSMLGEDRAGRNHAVESRADVCSWHESEVWSAETSALGVRADPMRTGAGLPPLTRRGHATLLFDYFIGAYKHGLRQGKT